MLDGVLKTLTDWNGQCLMQHKALLVAFHTLRLGAPNKLPTAQLLKNNACICYIFMLTIGNKVGE